MSSSKLNRQSPTRTAGSPTAEATRSVDQKRSARGGVLTNLTLSALGFPSHASEEGSHEDLVRYRHRRRTRHVSRGDDRDRENDRVCPARAVRAREPRRRNGEWRRSEWRKIDARDEPADG